MHVVGGGRGQEDGRTRRGRPARPSGLRGSARGSRVSAPGRPAAPACCRSRSSPGAIAFTFTPCGAHSFASARTSPATPDFDAVYETTLIPPWKLSMDAVKMIFPAPRSTIGRAELAGEHELRRQVRLQHALPLLVVVHQRRRPRDRARVVDEDVDSARRGAPRRPAAPHRRSESEIGAVGGERAARGPRRAAAPRCRRSRG